MRNSELIDYLLDHIDDATSTPAFTNPSITRSQMWKIFMDAVEAGPSESQAHYLVEHNIKKEFR
jgi:hypothetical protein